MKTLAATASDRERIHQIYLESFDESESEAVADLADSLLCHESSPASIHRVAEVDGELVGHLAFSPVFREDTKACIGYILAPLAVTPSRQNQGIGTALVRDSLEAIRTDGIVFVYGDPAYYSRFGFSRELARSFLPPHPLTQPAGWQAMKVGEFELPDSTLSIRCVDALSSPDLW